jgi:hypothetical protein
MRSRRAGGHVWPPLVTIDLTMKRAASVTRPMGVAVPMSRFARDACVPNGGLQGGRASRQNQLSCLFRTRVAVTTCCQYTLYFEKGRQPAVALRRPSGASLRDQQLDAAAAEDGWSRRSLHSARGARRGQLTRRRDDTAHPWLPAARRSRWSLDCCPDQPRLYASASLRMRSTSSE